MLTLQLQRHKEKHEQPSTIYRNSTFLQSTTINPVSHWWCCTHFVSSSRTDTLSTSTIPTTSTISTATRQTVSTRNWISSSAGIRNSTICRSTTTTATSAAAAAGGCGQCCTATSSGRATSTNIHGTYRLRMHRHVVLQLALWTHRFHTGQSVYFISEALYYSQYLQTNNIYQNIT